MRSAGVSRLCGHLRLSDQAFRCRGAVQDCRADPSGRLPSRFFGQARPRSRWDVELGCQHCISELMRSSIDVHVENTPRAPVWKPPGHGTWIQRMSDWTSWFLIGNASRLKPLETTWVVACWWMVRPSTVTSPVVWTCNRWLSMLSSPLSDRVARWSVL